MAFDPNIPPIAVIGAGVIGLTTARLFQQRRPDQQVIIIAAEFPGDPNPSADYASAWAGAHYRPIPGSTEQLLSEAKLAQRTAEIMMQIANETPEAGIEIMQGVEYLESPPPANTMLKVGDLYAGHGDGFRILSQDELPRGAEWGCEYWTYCINVPVYCSWLLKGFVDGGGHVIRQGMSCAEDAFGIVEVRKLKQPTTVVNCSGRNFDLDPKTRIIRGQTVLVKQQYSKTVTRQNKDGSWTFLIPRSGGVTIVGGSKELDDREVDERPETTQKVLEQAVRYFPDFAKTVGEFDVLKVNVGRRPWREGGMRLEVEHLSDSRKIVHGYGAGGRGYELSHGVAEMLFELADSCDVTEQQQQRVRSLL